MVGQKNTKVVCDLHSKLKLTLVGGPSHVGKSTVSKSMAESLGWLHVSTDALARHPGRPWKPKPHRVPDHVAEHYTVHSVCELLEDVLRHYRMNVWPKVEAIIRSHATDAPDAGIVLEGSALWPEFIVDADLPKIAAIWLTASEEVLRQRIHVGSLYGSKSPRERKIIDRFLDLTIAYNTRMGDAVSRNGFILVDVERFSVKELTSTCLRRLGIHER